MKELRAIELEINSHCNRACSYCPNVNQRRIEQGYMSKEMFDKILFQLQQINYAGRISFSFYNEPLLVNDLDYFAARVKEFLPQTNLLIYTNGTLLTIERFKNLVLSGVDYFIVTKHEHEENYSFDQVYQGLPEEIREKYIKYQSFENLVLTNRGGLLSHIRKEGESINLPCLIPLHVMTISNKGTVIPCFEDYYQVHEMGNINQNTIEEIWNSSAYATLRKKLLLGFRKDYKVCYSFNRH